MPDKEQTNNDNYKSTIQGWVVIIFLIIEVIALIGFSRLPQNDPTSLILSFQRSSNLICQASLGGRASLLVNKHDGWSIYKNKYFKKGDELVKITYCTQVERGGK